MQHLIHLKLLLYDVISSLIFSQTVGSADPIDIITCRKIVKSTCAEISHTVDLKSFYIIEKLWKLLYSLILISSHVVVSTNVFDILTCSGISDFSYIVYHRNLKTIYISTSIQSCCVIFSQISSQSEWSEYLLDIFTYSESNTFTYAVYHINLKSLHIHNTHSKCLFNCSPVHMQQDQQIHLCCILHRLRTFLYPTGFQNCNI